jgi:hypothetical protein
MTDKKFKVAGVSKNKAGYKVRFANDLTRVKVLSKVDEDVNLMDLPQEMTKPEIVKFLKATDLYKNADYQMAIDAADEKYNGEVVVKVKADKKTKAAKPSMESLKARAEAATEPEAAE